MTNDWEVLLGEGAGVPAPSSAVEVLTAQFYDWERRARGWQVWPYPVSLEPPFVPFHFHYVPTRATASDDGRRPTFLSGIVDGFRRAVSGPPSRDEPWADDLALDEPDAEPTDDFGPLAELRLSVPPSLRVATEAVERFLGALPVGIGQLGFEVVGTAEMVSIQLVVPQSHAQPVARLLRAHLPEITVSETAESLRSGWNTSDDQPRIVIDFGLAHEFMLPLRIFRDYDPDPLIGIASAVSDLGASETAILQVLFEPVRHPWAQSIMRSVQDDAGGSFFLDAPEMAKIARQKVSSPLLAAVVRLGVRGPDPHRVWETARALGGALRTFADPAGNELIPLTNDDYDEVEHEEDLLLRRSRRSGMILNLDEIISFVHPPSASIKVEKLAREVRKTRPAPGIVAGSGLVLGTNTHAGRTVEVALTPDQRSRHMYVIGASGTGKSTLLLNLIIQDLHSGQGLCVLDPHGDLIDRVLGYVPKERVSDVVLFDPADADYPVGFNILSAHSDLEKTLLESDLVAVFRRLSTSWGDQMTSVLGNAILALLESEQGGTLIDLRRFLVERDFRERFLVTVHDPDVVYYWRKEFPLLKGNPQASILTRLDTFLRPKLIRYMVAQREDRLNFRAMMDEGKILLARLSQGAIGEENAQLLGSLLVAKLQQVAMSRQDVAEESRRPFHVYVDEFHHFVTPTMEQILSGTRKYGLDLTLAHQDLQQVRSRSPEVLNSVLTNAHTRLCFSVGDQDAKTLAQGFTSFETQDLQNLSIGQVICRVERAEYDFNLDTAPAALVDPKTARTRREEVVASSREKYARRREDIEAILWNVAAEPDARVSHRDASRTDDAGSTLRSEPDLPAPPPRMEVVPAPPGMASSTPGRGGRQHKYLQELLSRWAEANGWRVTIEERILNGLGNVDVAMRKGDHSIACEIGITTTPEHEAQNIQKCLAGGFERVLCVSPDKKILATIRDLAEAELSERDRARVRYTSPEEALATLEEIAMEAAGEKTVHGYKVRLKLRAGSKSAQDAKRAALSTVIARTIRRLGKKDS